MVVKDMKSQAYDNNAPIRGVHICVDFYGCKKSYLDDPQYLRDTLVKAAKHANATVLGICEHKFQPHGVTTLLLLAESHISIHTWPEHDYAAIDVFTCGPNMDPQKAVDYLRAALEAHDEQNTTLERGMHV